MKAVYEAITAENREEYRPWILPPVWEEIAPFAGDLSGAGCFGIGVRMEEGTAGAVVADQEEGGDLSIRSIYIRKKLRQNGLGRGLLHRLLDVAAGTFPFREGEEGYPVLLKCQYALPWEEEKAFTGFLKAAGFQYVSYQPSVYRLTAADLLDMGIGGPGRPDLRVVRLTSLPPEQVARAEEQGADPDVSYAYLKDGAPVALLLCARFPSGDLEVLSTDRTADVTDRQMLSLFHTAAQELFPPASPRSVFVTPFDDRVSAYLADRLPPEAQLEPVAAWTEVVLVRGGGWVV